jgi:hypothetical protein
MTGSFRTLSTAGACALVLGLATTAWSAPPQDPSTGGQENKCWGETASGLAKLDGLDGTNGGGMGQHSRSTQAANTNGGFASDDNGFGITFNVDGGREGVGNVSKGGPHNVHPGDGGNGVHAANNGQVFAAQLDPVTGLEAGDDPRLIPCEGAEPNIP